MPFKFTFHYVSIKTTLVKIYTEARDKFTFHYVSIKTKKIHICIIGVRKFTFHYVSIKTAMETFQGTPQANLHSTMYLLKP